MNQSLICMDGETLMNTVLIVIDTLQHIRGGVNDANPYASDYRDLGILKELLACLLNLEQDTPMDAQEVAVIDQLLEHIEVSVRTTCDLIRFKCMKSAGIVQSMDEFLELFYSEEE